MKEITAWTVKTRTGRVYPSWIFESEDEAWDFCAKLNENCRPQKHYVVSIALIYEPIITPTPNL